MNKGPADNPAGGALKSLLQQALHAEDGTDRELAAARIANLLHTMASARLGATLRKKAACESMDVALSVVGNLLGGSAAPRGDEAEVLSYLRTAVENKIRAYARRQGAAKRDQALISFDAATHAGLEPSGPSQEIDAIIDRVEMKFLLEDLGAILDDSSRALLSMWMHGATPAEIGLKKERSANTVSQQLVRIRQDLRIIGLRRAGLEPDEIAQVAGKSRAEVEKRIKAIEGRTSGER